MGYPREIYQQASAVLSARRQQANEQTLMHRREIYALLPQIEKYDKELAQIGMKTIQAVAGSPDQVETIIERLKQQSLGLQSSGMICLQRRDCWRYIGMMGIPARYARTAAMSVRKNASVFLLCCGKRHLIFWEQRARRTAALKTFHWTITARTLWQMG